MSAPTPEPDNEQRVGCCVCCDHVPHGNDEHLVPCNVHQRHTRRGVSR